MKKLLALLLALLLVLSALIACSPDGAEEDDSWNDEESDDVFPQDDGTDPAMPDVNWPADLPLN